MAPSPQSPLCPVLRNLPLDLKMPLNDDPDHAEAPLGLQLPSMVKPPLGRQLPSMVKIKVKREGKVTRIPCGYMLRLRRCMATSLRQTTVVPVLHAVRVVPRLATTRGQRRSRQPKTAGKPNFCLTAQHLLSSRLGESRCLVQRTFAATIRCGEFFGMRSGKKCPRVWGWRHRRPYGSRRMGSQRMGSLFVEEQAGQGAIQGAMSCACLVPLCVLKDPKCCGFLVFWCSPHGLTLVSG